MSSLSRITTILIIIGRSTFIPPPPPFQLWNERTLNSRSIFIQNCSNLRVFSQNTPYYCQTSKIYWPHEENVGLIALMRVFPEVIALTTKPRIDAYVLFTWKWDLVVRTIALGKTRISAIECVVNQPIRFVFYIDSSQPRPTERPWVRGWQW